MASRLERLETEILPQLSLCVPAAEPRNARHTRSLAVPDKRGAFCATQRAARSRAAPGNAGAHARRARRHQCAHQRRSLKHGEARLRRMFFCACTLCFCCSPRGLTRARPAQSRALRRAAAGRGRRGWRLGRRRQHGRRRHAWWRCKRRRRRIRGRRNRRHLRPRQHAAGAAAKIRHATCVHTIIAPLLLMRCFAPLTLLSSYDMQSKTQR